MTIMTKKRMAGITFSAQRLPTQPPPGDPGPHLWTIETLTPKVSFRDKVMGDKPAPPPLPKRDLVAENLMTITYEEGNPLLPEIKLDGQLFNDLCEPWRDALVIKFLGKSVGY